MKVSSIKYVVPALALAIVATTAVGVTYASSKGSSAKACVNSKGVLVLASSKGKCPKGDSKVTIGKRGAKGKTGPSNGYVDTVRAATPLTVGDAALLSLDLPAGSYQLTASVNISNTGGAQANPGCLFETGAGDALHSVEYQTDVPAQTGSAPIGPFPGLGTISLSTGVKLSSAATVIVHCGSPSSVLANGSFSAVKVGSLTPTGASAFS